LQRPVLEESQTLDADSEYPASSEQCWHFVEQQANPAGHIVHTAAFAKEKLPFVHGNGCCEGDGHCIPEGQKLQFN